MIRGSLVAAALWLCVSPAYGGDEVLRNRLTLGADMRYAAQGEEPAWGMLLNERMRAQVVKSSSLEGQFLFNGRMSYQIGEEAKWDETRVRDARIHLDHADWEADFGRIPIDGGSRIVDGARVLAVIGERWRLGAWAGSGADPYTTLPLGRYGGGPELRYQSDTLSWITVGEVMVAPEGLDRASVVSTAMMDPSRVTDLSARLDLQYSGPQRPISIADAALFVSTRPTPKLRLDALYDGYSSYTYLATEKQDPALTRFERRALAVDPGTDNPQDTLDTSMYHLFGGGVRWTEPLAQSSLELGTRLRYRWHPLIDRQYGRATLRQGLRGMAGGHVDLAFEQSASFWGGRPGWDAMVLGFFEPFERSAIAFDGSVQLGIKPLLDRPDVMGSYQYADLFMDWLSPDGLWMVSAGYGYSRVLDLELWDQHHAVLARVTWNLRLQRERDD